jgi:hypothetical protein
VNRRGLPSAPASVAVVTGLLLLASAWTAGEALGQSAGSSAMGDPVGTPAAADSRAPVIAIEMSEATLQGGAARLIRRELDRLWSPYGLNVAWTDGVASDSGECVAVKVVFTDDEPGIKAGPNRLPLGIVYRVGDLYRRVIFVSPAAVMRLVRKSSNEPRESQLVDSLHARMMARVISHELGHILLESEAHAPRGLMRGRFRPSDVVQHGREPFTLEPGESDRVASRCGGKFLHPLPGGGQ